MAKSLKKIYDMLVDELQQYQPSDDFPIPRKLILDKIHDARAAIIRREYKDSKKIDPAYYQPICCVEVDCLPQGCTFNGVFVASGETIWHAVLPALITDVDDLNLIYVGQDNYSRPWSLMNFEAWMNVEGNIATGTLPAGTIVGSDLYLKNLPTQGIKFICIIALVYDPTSVCNWDDDKPYPAPDDMTIQMLVKKDINAVYPILPDNRQDSRPPEVNQQQRPQRQQATNDDAQQE